MAVPAVTSCTRSHTVVIAVSGTVDEAASQQLRSHLIEAMMRRRPRRIVVDLTEAADLDPGAVGTLIAAHESAPDMALSLTFRCANAAVAAELAAHGLPTATETD